MKFLHFLPVVLLAACSTSAPNPEYAQNLKSAKAICQAHCDGDYDTWKSYFAEDAVIHAAEHGSAPLGVDEAAEFYSGFHAISEDITYEGIFLPGVDTLQMQPDGSVRAYIQWDSKFKPTGEPFPGVLKAYHYWNFENGKVNQAGTFYDAGGFSSLIASMMPAETPDPAAAPAE